MTSNFRKWWTPERISELLRLQDVERKPWPEIACLIGATSAAACSRKYYRVLHTKRRHHRVARVHDGNQKRLLQERQKLIKPQAPSDLLLDKLNNSSGS